MEISGWLEEMPWRKWLMLSGECLRCSEQQPVNHSNHKIKGTIIFIYFPRFLSLSVWVTHLCVFSAVNVFSLCVCVCDFHSCKKDNNSCSFREHNPAWPTHRYYPINTAELSQSIYQWHQSPIWTPEAPPPLVATVFVWKAHSSRQMTKNRFAFLFSSAF